MKTGIFIISILTTIILFFRATTLGQLPEEETMSPDLTSRFADPPAGSRILKIIHSWPDDPDQQETLISRLLDQGFGGVVCNVSFDQYMRSERKWDAFEHAVRKAKEAGMALWLYDERGYPSGVAGGLVLDGHPELEAEGLLIAEMTVENGKEQSLKLPPGELFQALALPEMDGVCDLDRAVDLSGSIRGGELRWQPDEGLWKVIAITRSRPYEGTHAQLSLADKLPYINLLDAEATCRFIEVTHEQYAARLGSDLGRWFVATFTDEPSLMSVFLKPMPYRVIPWSRRFPEEFESRRGYRIEPELPGLLLNTPSGRRVRYDFWRTVSELVSENFFGQIRDWCREHGIPSGGHLLAEEMIASHVPLYGDFFRCLRFLDAPSIDCLTSIPQQVPWFIARMATSAAALEGQLITMCETSDHSQVYRPKGDNRPKQIVTESEIRGTCNRLMHAGINTITSYYSFSGLSDEQLQSLNTWVGRCSTMLRGGYPAADIAVLYPSESLWVHYLPSRLWANDAVEAKQVEKSFRTVSEALYRANRGFLYIDSQTLQNAVVQDGALTHGNLSWRVLVLPRVDTLPTKAWEQIERFWRNGGVVVALGVRPENSEIEFPSPRVQRMADAMFGDAGDPQIRTSATGGVAAFLPSGSEDLLPELLNALFEPEIIAEGGLMSIRSAQFHRQDGEIFFLINDSPEPWNGTITLPTSEGPGEIWDPRTGSIRPISSGREVGVELEEYGAIFLRFDETHRPKRLPMSEDEPPEMVLSPLPNVEPVLGHGEFVRAEVHAEPLDDHPDLPGWRAVGQLTKSDVNTHLFLGFRYPDPVDLSKASAIVFDSWVPHGQQTPTELLVILRDEDQAEYLASTGRSLAEPGYSRTYVSLTQFQLAGWSNDPDGRPDLDRVVAISIGWGGYYGRKDERITFHLALPQAGRINR